MQEIAKKNTYKSLRGAACHHRQMDETKAHA